MLNPNPFGPQQDPGGLFAALTLHKRLLKDIHAAKVDDQIFRVIQNALEDALKKDNIHILMPEVAKNPLLAQVMKQVLGDMLKRLEDSR